MLFSRYLENDVKQLEKVASWIFPDALENICLAIKELRPNWLQGEYYINATLFFMTFDQPSII